jgi:glycosyltransferase involved in cell wall biosynthesis
LRVAILFEFPTLNGGERSMLAALNALREPATGKDDRPPEIVAIAPASGPLANAIAEAGFLHVPWECRDAAGKRRPQPELLDELIRLTREESVDLLHANSLSMARLTGAVAPRLSVPTTGHLRDMIRLSAAAVADLNRNRRLIAVSNATRAFHAAQGVASDRMTTLNNGVDLERFAPRPATGWLKRELTLPDEAFLIATVGQIGLRKGHDTLAEAAMLIGPAVPRAHFLIIGERYSEKTESIEFERHAFATFESAGLGKRVHRLGYRHDMNRLLPEVDLLVHPARQEPLGRVLLEAAACGTPIIATDVGGTSEILRDGVSARLVPAGEPTRLADAVIELANSRPRRMDYALAARRRIEAQFDVHIASRKLKDQWCDVWTDSV